jgi:peptide methionine sulfoxide reductase MsrB
VPIPFTGKYWNTDEKVSIIALLAAINCFVLTESFLAAGWPSFEQENETVYFTKGQL